MGGEDRNRADVSCPASAHVSQIQLPDFNKSKRVYSPFCIFDIA